MKLIQPTYEIIEQQPGMQNMYKHIERCGRTCYKSEDKITDTSAEEFVNRMIQSNHGTVLEHGTVYLTIPLGTPVNDPQYIWKFDIVKFFQNNPYSKVKSKVINQDIDIEIKGYGMKTQTSVHFYYITTNWRVIIENRDFKCLQYIGEMKSITKTLEDSVLEWITEPTEEHERRYTVLFTCDIGVTREFNRHRKDSANEESTRYCNYGKSKFEQQLSIMTPQWLDNISIPKDTDIQDDDFRGYCRLIAENYDAQHMTDIDYWLCCNYMCEYVYMKLTNDFKWKAQQARTVLPLDTKSTLVHTAFASDWIHFFELRALGKTGAPHPSAKELAEPLMQEFISRKYIDEIK